MFLYHGSAKRDIVEFCIIPRDDNPPDFGDGVYFTSNYAQAKKWSCHNEKHEGAVYRIDIDFGKLDGIHADYSNDYLFLYVTYLNRINLRKVAVDCLDEIKDMDYIHGKMIKNATEFIKMAEAFNEGDIDRDSFIEKTKTFEKGYDQYCFRTQKSMDLINSSQTEKIFTKKEKNRITEDGGWMSANKRN